MASAKNKLKEFFLQHVGEIISREVLRDVAGNIQDWQRSLRQLRQETGLNIESKKDGYILTSEQPTRTPQNRKTINGKLRYAVLQRDNSTCQRCGRNPVNSPGIKLHVDHRRPVDLGGDTTIDNLWTLCEQCNEGKKAFFDDSDSELLNKIALLSSAHKRLKAYFESNPNCVISPYKLSIIANTRDWERALRKVRSDENMNIKWIKPSTEHPEGGYIYLK